MISEKLISEKSIWKNQVWRTGVLVFKNQFRNWFLKAKNPICRTWFFQYDFWNSSTDQKGEVSCFGDLNSDQILEKVGGHLLFLKKISSAILMYFFSFLIRHCRWLPKFSTIRVLRIMEKNRGFFTKGLQSWTKS